MYKRGYIFQTQPLVVPTDDGKLIKEHFGNASSEHGEVSVAHMIAPPGWGEPFQKPDFDEYTLMVRGKKQIEFENEVIIMSAGQSLLVKKGTPVRYSNPFKEEAEYWSVCIPAFSIETVHRLNK